MPDLKVEITRFVDDWQPGWVECRLKDAHGKDWLFVEKVPIVSRAQLDKDSAYPQAGIIACQVRERCVDAGGRDGARREVLTVDTELPCHVESTTGQTVFEVLPDQLTGLD